MVCTHESLKAVFSPLHTSDTQLSLTPPGAWFKLQEEITHGLSASPSLPVFSLPPLHLPPFPSPFCSHSSSQQCRVLLSASRKHWNLTPLCMYSCTMLCTHTHPRHVEKYCPLHCPLLHLPFFYLMHASTHTETLFWMPANSPQCIKEHSQGHCSGEALSWLRFSDNCRVCLKTRSSLLVVQIISCMVSQFN